MRDDRQRIEDALTAAETILDYLSGMAEAELATDSKTIDAVFFNVIVLGEAVSTLLAGPGVNGREQDARIAAACRDWLGAPR